MLSGEIRVAAVRADEISKALEMTGGPWPELKKKIEVLEEEIKKNMEKSAMSKTKKGQSRSAETRKSKPSRSQDSQRVLSMRQGVGMGPSSKREVKKEETGSGGTFEERRVDALEGLADSVEKLVRIVMAVLMI